MHPLLALRDRLTPLLLAKDMDGKLQEARSHLCWLKRPNQCKRSGNGSNIAVLAQNPLRQVTHHPGFAGHDRFEVPTYVLKRRHVSSVLVRPPDDITMLQRIHQSSEVSSISKPPGFSIYPHTGPLDRNLHISSSERDV